MIATKPGITREPRPPTRQAEFKQTEAKVPVDMTLPDQSIDISALDDFEFDDNLMNILNEELETPNPADTLGSQDMLADLQREVSQNIAADGTQEPLEFISPGTTFEQ